jgi:hypothetical protein
MDKMPPLRMASISCFRYWKYPEVQGELDEYHGLESWSWVRSGMSLSFHLGEMADG